eukprot:8641679-Pyramimonas_sp.AAC.1
MLLRARLWMIRATWWMLRAILTRVTNRPSSLFVSKGQLKSERGGLDLPTQRVARGAGVAHLQAPSHAPTPHRSPALRSALSAARCGVVARQGGRHGRGGGEGGSLDPLEPPLGGGASLTGGGGAGVAVGQ